MRKFVCLLLATMFIITVIPSVGICADEKPIKVQLNGNYLDFDVAPTMINDRVMIPFRAIAEKIGVTVKYDEASQQIIATKGERTLTFTVGNSSAVLVDKDGPKNIEMDAAPVIVDDRTLVPLRALAETMDIEVGWDRYENSAILVDYSYFVERVKQETPNLYKSVGLIKLLKKLP